jgi:hypothetical protein
MGKKNNLQDKPAYYIDPKDASNYRGLYQPGTTKYEESSQYDQGLLPGYEAEEFRAYRQPWEDKLGNGLVNMTTSAFTGALESTVGIVYGAGAALFSGDASSFYDNEFGRSMDAINNSVRESNPFYYSEAEKNASLLGGMGYQNFWFDKVLGGAGYTIGSLAAGYGMGKLFQMGKTARLAQVTDEVNAAAKAGELTSEALKYSRWDMGKQIALGGVMAHGESSMEARQTYDSTVENYTRLRALANDPNTDAETRMQLADYANLTDEKIEQLGRSASDTNYLVNMAVTGPTDMILLGKFINPGKKAAMRTYNEIGKRTAVGGTVEYFDKMATKKARALLDNGTSFLKGFATEGIQEGTQFASNIAAQEFAELHGIQKKDWFDSITSAIGEGLSETFTSKEGLESILVGGIVGGPFGLKGAGAERKAQDARTKTLIDARNADPEFTQANPKVNAFLGALNAANKSEESLMNGDLFKAKNESDQALNHYIKTQIDLGTADYFVEKLQGIKEMEQEERDKHFGPGTTPEQIDQVIGKVEKLSQLNDAIETLYGTPGGTPEQKAYNEALRQNLFFAASTIADVEQRINSIQDELTGLQDPEVQQLLALRENVKNIAKDTKVTELSDEAKVLIKNETDRLNAKIESEKRSAVDSSDTERRLNLLKIDPEKYFNRNLEEKKQKAAQYDVSSMPGSLEMKDVDKAAKELDTIINKKSFLKPLEVPEGKTREDYARELRDAAIDAYNQGVKEYVTNNPVKGNQVSEMLADLNQLDNRKYSFVEYYNELNDPELAAKRILEQKTVMEELAKLAQEDAQEQQEVDALSKLNLETLDNIVKPNTRRENTIKYNNTDVDLSKMEDDKLEELLSDLRFQATDARIEGLAEEADALTAIAAEVSKEIEFRKKAQELINEAKDALAKATTPEQVDALIKTLVDSGYFNINPEEVAKLKENVAKKAAVNNSIQQRIERKINPMFRGADEFYLSFTDGNAQMKSQFEEAINRKDAEKRIYLKIKPNVDSAGNSLAGKVSRIGKGETMNTRVQNVSPRFVVEIWSQGSATEGDVHIGYMRWPGQYADANGLPLNIQDLTGTGDPVKNEEMYRLLFEPDESQGARSYTDFKNAHSKLEQTFKQLEGIYDNPVNKGKPEIVLSTAKTAELVNVSITKGNYSIENTEVPLVDFLKEDTATPPLIMDGTPVIVSTSTYDGSSNVFYTKRNNSTENPNAITTQTKVASVMNDKGNPVLFDPTVVGGGTRPEFIPALEKLREILSSPKIGETIYNKYWMLVYDPQGSITIEGMEGKFDWRPMTSRSLNNDERNNIFQKVNELRALLNTIDPNLPPQQSVKDALKELNNSFFMALQSSDVAKSFKNISVGFTGSPAEGLGLKIDFRTLGGEQLDQLVDEQGNVTRVMSYKGEIYMNIPNTVQSFDDLIVWLNDQMQRPQQVRWEVKNQDKPTRRQMAPLSTKLAPVTLSNLRVNFVGEASAAGGEINKGLSAVTPENVYDSFSTNVSRTNPRTNRRLRLEPTAKAAIAAPSPSVQPVTTATAPTVTQPPVTVAPPAQPQIISLAPGLTSGEGEAVPAQQPSLESVMQMVSKHGLIRKTDIPGKPDTWIVIDVMNLPKEERDVIKGIVGMTASTKEELLEKIKQKYSAQGAAPASTPKGTVIGYLGVPSKDGSFSERSFRTNLDETQSLFEVRDLGNGTYAVTFKNTPYSVNMAVNEPTLVLEAVSFRKNARNENATKLSVTKPAIYKKENGKFVLVEKMDVYFGEAPAQSAAPTTTTKYKREDFPEYQERTDTPITQKLVDYLADTLGVPRIKVSDNKYSSWIKEQVFAAQGMKGAENLAQLEWALNGPRQVFDRITKFAELAALGTAPAAPITPTAPTRRGRNMTAEEAKKAGNKPGPVRSIGQLKNMKLSGEERIKLEDAFARLSKILPSWITAEEMAPLLENWKQGRVTFGSFFNNVIKLSRLAPSGTELHEAFHAVFRALLTDKQQDALYKEAKDMMIRDLKKQGKSFLQGFEQFKKERPDYTEKATMTEEQLKALYIEEWMADEYARQSKQKKTKQAAREARKGTIASLWDQFMDLVDRIFRFFTGQKQLTRLFQDIDAGRFKAAEKPVINRFSRDPELNIEARSAIQVGYKEGMDGSVHAAFLDPEYQNRFVNTIASTVLERLNLSESIGTIASTMIDEEIQKLGETFAFANYPEIDFNNPDPSVMDKVELLDDFNFLLNDTSDEAQQARNKFKQEIILKLKELNVDEFDSAANEGYDGSEDITERSFDLNNENKGGFKSLSKVLRKYIGTTTYTTTLDEFLGLEPGSLFGEKTITTAVDPKRVYNGIVKIAANQADPSGVIKKMNYYRRTPGESTEFINKFFEDAGIVFDENGDFTYNAAKTPLVQRVVKGFNLFEVNYLFTAFSPGAAGKNKPDTKTYSANRKGMDMQQVESWNQRYGDLLVRRGKEKIQKAASEFQVTLLTSNLVDKTTNQPRALTNDEVSQFARTTRQKLMQLGISLSEQYLEYIVLADPNKIKTPDQFKFVQEFSDSVKLSAAEVKKSLEVITGLMSQDKNPYEKGTVVDGEGAVTRLLKIAADNAVFDETVVISTMINAEGKNIYPYQKASYHVQKIYELQNIDLNDPDVLEQIQKEKPNSDFLVGNRLLANETFRTMLSNLAIERIEGMRQMEIDENGKASSKKTANEGVTYGKMTKRELALAMYSMFADSSTDATILTTNPEGKLISTKAAVRRTLFNILEASNTADVLKLPVTNYLDQNGRITDEFKQAYLAEIKREYDRIERVRNNEYVDQYNKFNAFAKEEDQRGRKFWDTKEMLDSIDGGALRRQLETGEISFEEAIPAIMEQMNPYFMDELKKNIDNLKEIGVLKEDGTNRLLPKKYEGGSSEDTMFGPIMQSNIANAYLNDLMNSMAINQILMGDPALSLKNNVDWFKRARGNNASGDNMLGIDANKNAKPVRVVTMGTLNDKGELDDFYNEEYKVATRIYKIGSPEYEKYRESLSPEERKDFDEKKPKQIAIADAQAYTTVRGMGRIMESLGRMTPEGFEIYKKIGNNEKLTEKEWDYLRTHDLMLNSQKLVYYDGVTYVKMSVAVLSPDYTSDKNGNPRPGMEFLDNMRRNMQEKDIDLLGPPSMMKKMIKNPYIVDPSNPDFDIQDSNVQLLDKGYLRLQQENPSNKTYIKDPTQQQNIITAEQSSAPVEFPWNSNIKTGRDLVAYYDKLLAERVKTTYVPARNFLLALKNNKWTLDLKRATRAFRKTLEETGASPQVLAYLEVDENGYPIYNLNAPNIVKEFEQHFNAYFNKVLSQKVPGYKTTLQSGFMHRVLEDTQTGKIINTIEYDADPSKYSDRNRYKPRRLAFDVPRIINGKEVHRYSEVVIPFHFAEQFGLKPGDAIPEEIAYLFGTRIPSQDKHSALVLKIVDVLPPHYGSNMIAPDELVLLTGSDFDVDSFFNQRFDHYVKDGKFKAYGNNEDSKWDQFKMWHRANNRLVKDLMEEMEGDLEFKRTLKQLEQPLIEADLASERVSELGMAGEGYDALTEREKQALAEKPENLEAYKRAKKIIDDLRDSNFIKALKILGLPSTEAEFSKSDLRTIGEINNDILNARMVLHSNPAMNDINKTPATIDPIEEALDTFAKALGYTRWQEMNTAFSPNSINGKLEAFETNKAGQTAIGASVNNTNNFSIISRFGIQKSENEKNPVQDVIIEGKDPNDPIVVGTISPEIFVTEDNKRIMDVNSTLTSSMTDNTKYGYNSKLNLDIETLSVVSMLVMNRVRLYDALRLVNSQYVVKYLKESQQFAIQSTSEEMAKKEVDTELIQELIKKARDASGGTLTNEEISKAARGPVTQNDLRLVVLHNPRSKMLSKMSINERNQYYKNLDSQEYYDYLMAELRILNAYLTISKKHSPEFIAFSQIVKLTKGIASSTKETSFKGDEDLRHYLKTLNLKLVETKDGWRVDYGDAKPEELPLYDFKNILNNHLISLANLSVFADKTEAQKNYFISQTFFAEKLRTLINKGLKKRMKNKTRTKAMTQLRRDMESFLMIRAWRNSLPENERENLNNYLYNHIAEKNGVKSLVDLKQELLKMYPHLEKNLMFTQVFFKNDGEGVLSKVETNTRTKGNKGFEGMIMSAVRSMANNEGYPLINAMIKHLIAKNGLQFKNESPVGLLAPSIYGNEFPFSQLMDSYTDMLNTLDDASFKEMFGMTPVELMEEFQELFMLDINNRDYITKLTEGRTLKNPILEKAKTSPVTVTETGFTVDFDKGVQNKKNVPIYDEQGNQVVETLDTSEDDKGQYSINFKVMDAFQFTKRNKNEKIGDKEKSVVVFDFPKFIQIGMQKYKLKEYATTNEKTRFSKNPQERFSSKPNEDGEYLGIAATYEKMDTLGYFGVSVIGRTVAEANEVTFDQIKNMIKNKKNGGETLETAEENSQIADEIDEGDVSITSNIPSEPIQVVSQTAPVTPEPSAPMSKQDQQVQKNIQALSATAVTAGAADTVAKDLLKFSLVSKGVAAIQAMYMKMYAAAGLDMSKLPAIFAKLAKTGILLNKSATNDQFKDVVEKVVNEATVEEVNEMNQKLC